MIGLTKELQEKERQVVAAYNEASGRAIKFLPDEKRVRAALEAFDLEDFKRVFDWAQDDRWCVENDILKTRVGYMCSYNVLAEHSDYVRPDNKAIGGESWTLDNLTLNSQEESNHTSTKL